MQAVHWKSLSGQGSYLVWCDTRGRLPMVALSDSIADDLSGPGLCCWPRSCKEVDELLWMPPADLEVGHTAPSCAARMVAMHPCCLQWRLAWQRPPSHPLFYSRAHLGSNGGHLNTFLAKAFCYACACLGGATAEQVCVHADLARALPPGGKAAAMEKALAVLPCMG